MKRNNLPVFLLTIFFCFGCFFAMAQPKIGGYNVYYGHLHNHTGVSDGTGTPDQAYLYARDNAHLDFFSLSEHSEMMTSTEWTTVKNAANKYNEDGVFTTFSGFEWSSVTYGHVSVINTSDYCSFLSSSTDNFTELLSWVNARNGIAFFNHPGWSWLAWQEFNKFTSSPSNKFVGMELWNDVDGFSKYFYNDGYYSNDGGKNYFEEALARGWKIGAAGSDDNHVSSWGTRTDWRVGVLANALTRTEIMNAFIARRFFTTLDKNLSLSLKVNGAEMGSTTAGGSDVTVVIEANDGDGEIFIEVQLIKNGSVLYTWTPFITNPVISQNITCSNGDYFYVKVTQSLGDEAISSPVFIEGTANQAPVVSISSPANGSTFYAGDQININVTASDPDGTVSKVEFYQGTTLIGNDDTSPYTCAWSGASVGTYQLTAKAIDNNGASTVSSPVSVSIVEPQSTITFTKRVSSGSDDAEQYSKGAVILGDPALNIVYESKTTGNQIIGLRFSGLDIPKGATITKAYIEFTADKASSGTASLILYGEATDNASTFTTASKNISSRKKTAASVAWIPIPWTAEGIVYKSDDIKTIVQEIVNRSGWISGNSMAFIITGTGTRTAESYEGTPSEKAPLLHVEYSTTQSSMIAEKSAVQPDENVELTQGIKVYPNPVNNILTIRLDEESEIENILIYSITGSLVRNISVNQKLIEKQVDCNDLIAGVYLMKIKTFNKSYSVKFIKQ
jgi:hypothetical protein